MVNVFQVIKMVASEIDEAIVFFSTGKDSIVTLDLCHKYFKKIHVVHLYIIPKISYREKFLAYYEQRYGVSILRFPHWEISSIIKHGMLTNPLIAKKNKSISFKDTEEAVRQKVGCRNIAYGYRKSESLPRRAQLNKCHGFERDYGRFFPIADWTANHVEDYLRREKLPLPVEYSFGFRDITFPTGDSLLWLRQNYPEDYKRSVKMYPFLEAEALRVEKTEFKQI